MNAQDLKNSILQLAVQGKLVEQRPEEGTAKELLAQIKAEKEQLIKDKKIKKEMLLPKITEAEIPFDIPESWIFVRVGEIGSWSAGATPSRHNPEYYNGAIPWLKTGDLNDGYVSEIPEFVSELALEKTSLRLNPVGSVLMAMYGATIGKLGILQVEATTNQACCACIPYSCITNKYLFYYLMAQRKSYIGMGAGGAQPNISKEKIVLSLIALPPLAEQKRIVAKIEELLPYIEQYDEAHTKLEAFNKKFPEDMKKSILQLAMQGKLVEQRPEEGTAEELYEQIVAEKTRLIKEGKIKKEKPLPKIAEDEIPFEIPESWKWVRMGEIGETNIGLTYQPMDVCDTGMVVLRSSNIQNGKLDYEDVVRVGCEVPDRARIHKGDLLICARNGSRSLVGKTAIVDRDGMAFGAFMAKFCSGMNEFVYFFLQSSVFRNQLDGVKTETINQITQNMLRKQMFPLPPLAEQERIVTKLKEILPYCNQLIE